MDESGIIELQLRRTESAIEETARKSTAEPGFRHGDRVLLSSSQPLPIRPKAVPSRVLARMNLMLLVH